MGRGRGVAEHLWVSLAREVRAREGCGCVRAQLFLLSFLHAGNLANIRILLITESESLFFKAPSLGRSAGVHAITLSVSVNLREASLVYTGNSSTLGAPGQPTA